MKHLSWTQVLIINLSLLTFAGFVIIQGSFKEPTRTKSQASVPKPTLPVTPFYPSAAPVISQVEYWYGKPGDQVRVRGQNFGPAPQASTLLLGDLLITKDFLQNWTDTIIDFTIPPTAVSGPVSLVVNEQSVTGPVLSVYHHPSDPQLQTITTANGITLRLLHAPLEPLTLKVNTQTYPLYPNADLVNVATAASPFQIETASLTDSSGNLLPLFQDPADLLP